MKKTKTECEDYLRRIGYVCLGTIWVKESFESELEYTKIRKVGSGYTFDTFNIKVD